MYLGMNKCACSNIMNVSIIIYIIMLLCMSVYVHGNAVMHECMCTWLCCIKVLSPFQHRFKLLTSQRIRSIMRCNDVESIKQYDFPNILQERIPGSPGHAKVKEVSSMLQCTK